MGQYVEAEREYRTVLAIRERLLGPEHRDTLSTRQGLTGVLILEEKYPEIEQELRSLLAAQEHLHGSKAAETLMWRQRLAYALYCQQKYAEAGTTQAKALAIAEKGTDDASRQQIVYACRALARYKLSRAILPAR